MHPEVQMAKRVGARGSGGGLDLGLGPGRWWVCLWVVGLAAWPATARADAGTPLVWATLGHLLAGNLLVAAGEAWLLGRWAGVSVRSGFWWMIGANYLSAWVGLMAMGWAFERFATDIHLGLRVTWWILILGYVATVFLEWPFVAWWWRGSPRYWGQALKGSALAQSASYLILLGLYWPLSGKSLYADFSVVAPARLSPASDVVLYYIAAGDGTVRRTELRLGREVVVTTLERAGDDDRLMLLPSVGLTNVWDLVVGTDRSRHGDAPVTMVVPRLLTGARVDARQVDRSHYYWGWGIAPFQAGVATNSTWRMGWAHWAEVGVWARREGETIRLSYGLPFGGWSPYRVVQLPGDQALVQLGLTQICLMDLGRREVTLVARGRGFLAFERSQLEPGAWAEADRR